MKANKLLVAGAWALAVAGCAADARNTPRSVLAAYADALERGRVREAYDLLSEDAQRSIPFGSFERMVRENPSEAREIARSIQRPTAQTYVTATVTGPDGQAVLLVYEDGGWHIDASAIDLYSQLNPEAAVASFVRALEGKRYDVLMRFVPSDKLEGLTPTKLKAAWEGEQRDEMRSLLQALKAALPTAQAEQLGDRATLPYGSGGRVELVRENGIWKVEEF